MKWLDVFFTDVFRYRVRCVDAKSWRFGIEVDSSGFTLLELLTVLAITAVLFAMASSPIYTWVQNARYRKAARDVASVLRMARAKAISLNQECTVVFDLDGRRYRMLLGDAASGTAITSWTSYPKQVDMGFGGDCSIVVGDGTPDRDNLLNFNPDGTAGGYPSRYVCILKAATSLPAFKAGLYSTTTGRIVIQRWSPEDSGWE